MEVLYRVPRTRIASTTAVIGPWKQQQFKQDPRGTDTGEASGPLGDIPVRWSPRDVGREICCLSDNSSLPSFLVI